MCKAEKLRNVQFFTFGLNFGPRRVFEHNSKTNSVTQTFFLLNLQLFIPVFGKYSQICWEKSEKRYFLENMTQNGLKMEQNWWSGAHKNTYKILKSVQKSIKIAETLS